MQAWAEEMVADLLDRKRINPLGFEEAWKWALKRHPARSRPGDDGEETLEHFFRRQCSDAWWGRQPLLAHVPRSTDHVDLEGTPAAGTNHFLIA
jgi:hypothetical protein